MGDRLTLKSSAAYGLASGALATVFLLGKQRYRGRRETSCPLIHIGRIGMERASQRYCATLAGRISCGKHTAPFSEWHHWRIGAIGQLVSFDETAGRFTMLTSGLSGAAMATACAFHVSGRRCNY